MEERMKIVDIEENILREIKDLFEFYDGDKNGFISDIELLRVLQASNPTADMKDAQRVIQQADKNGDGKISFLEFEAIMQRKIKSDILSAQDEMADLRKMFKQFDLDGNGVLSISEL
jgi:Ca2+-binding EF-hand superfamily protein